LVFAGTPEPAVPSLRALLASPNHEVVAVITRPAARAGRGRREVASPVAALAAEAGVEVLTPDRPGGAEFLARLSDLRVDCCPVVAYGALLPQRALDVPRFGWVNLHFSLLPAWRGAAPVQHAILHGDDVTGASTFQIEAGLDTGPVFGVVTEAIRPEDTSGDLLARLAESGAGLLLATMDGIDAGALVPVPQSADGVSVAGKITVEDAHVDWSAPAMHIDRQIRACTPAPGAWTTFRGERVKLGPVRRSDTDSGTGAGEPGELHPGKASVEVSTPTGRVLLGAVQPQGRKLMAAADWARGVRVEAGERLA
jgi:methionyl-tRNA formyltransferase